MNTRHDPPKPPHTNGFDRVSPKSTCFVWGPHKFLSVRTGSQLLPQKWEFCWGYTYREAFRERLLVFRWRYRGADRPLNRVQRADAGSPFTSRTPQLSKTPQTRKRKRGTAIQLSESDGTTAAVIHPKFNDNHQPKFGVASRSRRVNFRTAVVFVNSAAGAAMNEPADIDECLKRWRPKGTVDAALLETVLPTARAWVKASSPTDKADAQRMMRPVTGLLLWAHPKLGTLDAATVLSSHNIELWTMHVNKHREPWWLNAARSALRQVSQAMNPDDWPPKPKPIETTPPPRAYDTNEELTFKLLAHLPGHDNRAGRLWVTAATLGAGLAGDELVSGRVEDVTEVADRLVIQVRGDHERVVPVRQVWTPTLIEAIKAAEAAPSSDDMTGQFITARNCKTGQQISRTLAPANGQPLSLRRARSTWLAAHLAAATPLVVLRIIAGPVSMRRLNVLVDNAAETLDANTAYLRGLGA